MVPQRGNRFRCPIRDLPCAGRYAGTVTRRNGSARRRRGNTALAPEREEDDMGRTVADQMIELLHQAGVERIYGL
ncbi:hypothetical protein, partial [Pseudonocardia sp. Ae706_Ps2]|uniref:hypothetical protein n=1 Tax=Pseudonocardia sp. Ae706_Ps2 TaxID=1885035 RepID=UPI001C37B458